MESTQNLDVQQLSNVEKPEGKKESKHLIIGTAGHIDHGKTALIKALTGYDADRLEEEKKRGMTIELGFTSLSLPDGQKIGIVDTPGHEKFVKTMVAGAVGMDLVMVVISAKEGIMPQTREHLSILSLLGIKNFIICLTMIDLVSPEEVEQRKMEITEYLEKQFSFTVPIFPLSSFSKEGIPDLIKYLSTLHEFIQGKPEQGIFRMFVDRAFSIAGAGTVLTGTAMSGRIEVKKEYALYPKNLPVKVRNLQVHGKDSDIAVGGERVAVNLSSVDKSLCQKGDVLAEKDLLYPSSLLDCRVQVDNALEQSIKNNRKLELLLGTRHVLCKLVCLEEDGIPNKSSALVQLQCEEPVVALSGDRFILRDESQKLSIGGGKVIDPLPKGRHRRGRFQTERLRSLEDADEGILLQNFFHKKKGNFLALSAIRKAFPGYGNIEKALRDKEETGEITSILLQGEKYLILKEDLEEKKKQIQYYMKDFYQRNPYKIGEKTSVLYSRFFSSYNRNLYKALLEYWREKEIFRISYDILALKDYKMKKDEKYTKIANTLITLMQKAKFSFPKITEPLWSKEEEKILLDIVACLEEKGTLVQLEGEYYTLGNLFSKLKEFTLEKLQSKGEITVEDLREEFSLSRKNSKLFFKACDRLHITKDNGFESARKPYPKLDETE